MSLVGRIVKLRTGGQTERCHGVRHHGSYSVDKHSWGVAMLMHAIWPEHFQRLALVCLTHDVPEAWVGDLPAPTKLYSPSVKAEMSRLERLILDELELPVDEDLMPDDRARLKACDILELYFWAIEEVVGGNQHAKCVIRELERFVRDAPLMSPANEVFHQVRVIYEKGDWRPLERSVDQTMCRILGGKI